jgi:transcriptional regulator with XRE-family HTH domain
VRATARPEPNLGEVVRRLRTERSLSVRTLAGRCAFSPSFISQIELNQASPSIASLERLAAALDVTLGDFFSRPGVSADVPGVTRAAARQQLTSWWSRARIEALSPMGPGRPFEAVMIAIAAGGSSGKRPHAHPGEELAILFEGELRLTLANTVHMLGRGDAATFSSTTPHLWENRGKRSAHLLIVSSRFTH